MRNIMQLLDYTATHPDAAVTYWARKLALAAHSNASYLSETKSQIRAGGHFFMSSNIVVPENNEAVHTAAQIIKTVMSSTAETELGALYINFRESIPARHLLRAMGHKQPPTPMQFENSTALSVIINKIKPKRTKAMYMLFHWLRCRANQRQFRTYWRAGPTNKGDYVTKHHTSDHHKNVIADYLTPTNRLEQLRQKIQAIITGLASRVTDVARLSLTKSAARVC